MKKKGKIVFMSVAALIIIGIAAAMSVSGAAEADLYTVQKGSVQEYVELRGKVELDRKEKIFSKLTGSIQSVDAGEGETVDTGTALVKLEVQDIDLSLKKAQAGYDAAKANLEELKKSIKPEQVRQAEVQLEQSRIAVESAQKDYDYKLDKLEKTKLLHSNSAVSEQELKDIQVLVDAAQGVLDDTRKKYEVSRYNLDILYKGVSKSAVEAAEANAEQARLQVEELKNNMGRTAVYSGMKGMVLTRFIEKGAAVQPGTALYEIGDYASAYIRVDVLADDAGKVKIGQKAILSGDVVKKEEFRGEVYYLAPKAESKVSSLGVEQQRLEVRIRFDNSRLELKPGYGLDVKIVTAEKESAVHVPVKAVFDTKEGKGLFVVKNGKAELRTVKKGIENNDAIEIAEGLSEGETVINDPADGLKPGMRVK